MHIIVIFSEGACALAGNNFSQKKLNSTKKNLKTREKLDTEKYRKRAAKANKMAALYPIPFVIPTNKKIISVMLHKLHCGYIKCDSSQPCEFCQSGHFRYNEIMFISDIDDDNISCMIITDGNTEIITPTNKQVYNADRSYTINITSFAIKTNIKKIVSSDSSSESEDDSSETTMSKMEMKHRMMGMGHWMMGHRKKSKESPEIIMNTNLILKMIGCSQKMQFILMISRKKQRADTLLMTYIRNNIKTNMINSMRSSESEWIQPISNFIAKMICEG